MTSGTTKFQVDIKEGAEGGRRGGGGGGDT